MSAVPVTTRRQKARTRVRRKSLVSSQVSSRATTFLIIVGITYLVSSLTGQVMVEKARRDGIRAAGRALEARKVEAELSKKLDLLTSFASVDEWATTHNFLPPDQLVGNPEAPAPVVADAAAANVVSAPGTAGSTVPNTATAGSTLDQNSGMPSFVAPGPATPNVAVPETRRSRHSRHKDVEKATPADDGIIHAGQVPPQNATFAGQIDLSSASGVSDGADDRPHRRSEHRLSIDNGDSGPDSVTAASDDAKPKRRRRKHHSVSKTTDQEQDVQNR